MRDTPLPPAANMSPHSFTPSATTYLREHVMLAALGAVGLSGALFFMGNPHAWTGVVGSVLAIGTRGVYARSEQLGMVWKLEAQALRRPDGHSIDLAQVANVRTLFSAAQVITKSGEKYLIKYQADPAGIAAVILDARDTFTGNRA